MATTVMTGGTSGFGARAARRLAVEPHARVLLGSRRWPIARGAGASPAEQLELDLGSLASVRTFATGVRARLGAARIDALVLNAGILRSDVSDRSADWFETTFAVNHLAQYLLARLLLPVLAERATVVLTTSDAHDPATGSRLLPPRHTDVEMLAHPERDPDLDPRPSRAAEHAYTASKLCTLLTARTLATLPEVQAQAVTVVAYSPGEVLGTGLARHLPQSTRTLSSVLGSPLGAPLRAANARLNTASAAGTALAELAGGDVAVPTEYGYATLRRGRLTWPRPSELACRDDVAEAVWAASARLAELPG